MISQSTNEAIAICSRSQAETLVKFDHHRVKVENRWGILITYPWMPLEEAQEPLIAKVLFNPAPKHLPTPEQIHRIIFQHPLAPEIVQAIIDQLQFQDAVG
jgi:hypothetical protein